MKKIVFLSFLLGLCLSVSGQNFSKEYSVADFASAEKSADQVYFVLKTTTGFFFSGEVTGYALKFKLDADVNGEVAENPVISFKVVDFNTDNGSRDERMWDEILDKNVSDSVTVKLTDPLRLDETGEQRLPGTINIRGKDKDFSLAVKVSGNGDSYLVEGSSEVSLETLEVPSPSIAIATVDDKVDLGFKFRVPLSELP